MKLIRFARGSTCYFFGAAIALGIGGATWVADAQELTDSIAASFKAQGDREIDAGNYAAAVDSYDKGDRIQHHPVFDFNRARALQGASRNAEALDAIERFDREATTELKEKVPGYDEFVAQLRRSVAGVILVGAPHEARVSINGRDRGKLEVGKTIRCDSGSLQLRVEAEGYRTVSKRIPLSAGETRTVELKWERIDDRASIRLNASVPGAQVWVDERLMGQTPIELKLEPGKHRLRLEHQDALPLQTQIVVAARESREVTLQMPQPGKLWSKWWFWTGTAALATGLVIAGIALSTSKSPKEGDIAPGVVSGPLTAEW